MKDIQLNVMQNTENTSVITGAKHRVQTAMDREKTGKCPSIDDADK